MSMISDNIKKYRLKLKLSQEELARKAEITYSTLIKLESGGNDNPTAKTLIKLADVFNVSVDDLLGRNVKEK